MATSTENFKFKKPDESDFYDVQDQNGNWDIADQELEKLNNPTFEDYTGDTSVPAASTAIEELKSKSKLGVLLSNIKAAFKGACLIGHIVNNCVTDRSDLPLSAAQGKALMEAITVLNTKTPKTVYKEYRDIQINSTSSAPYTVLDTFSNIGVPTGGKVISITTRGWTQATGNFFLCKDSSDYSLVLVAPNGKFEYIGIEITYI